MKLITIPLDFPVQPLRGKKARETAKDPATCGVCGLTWDDAASTELTPTPAGRCPFESFHCARIIKHKWPKALDPLRCGGCGGDTFKLAQFKAGYGVRALCTGCGSLSDIVPEPAALKIDWVEDSDGRLCGGWGEKP